MDYAVTNAKSYLGFRLCLRLDVPGSSEEAGRCSTPVEPPRREGETMTDNDIQRAKQFVLYWRGQAGENRQPPAVGLNQALLFLVDALQALAALTADLAARGETIKGLEAAMELAALDIIFFHHDREGKVKPAINCNDQFAHAADAESIAWNEIPELLNRVKANGENEATKWVAERRQAKPLPRVQERLDREDALVAALRAQLIEERWQKNRAEFYREHDEIGPGQACGSPKTRDYPESGCHGWGWYAPELDPRHAYTPDDWRRDARAELAAEGKIK
jgi:hypothetical protein